MDCSMAQSMHAENPEPFSDFQAVTLPMSWVRIWFENRSKTAFN